MRDETRVRHLEQMRRDFISNVSHELRTPLAAMRLMAETLLGGALDEDEAARDFVNRIALEVEQMSQMVEELLQLSALEGGQRAVLSEPVPIDDLLSAIDRLRPLIDDKCISLILDIADGTPAIAGDPGQLQQVLRNLVHNAVKFSRPEAPSRSPPRPTVTLWCCAAPTPGSGYAPTTCRESSRFLEGRQLPAT